MADPVPPRALPRARLSFLRTWDFWSGLALVLIIGVLSYFYEDVKDEFPWLVTAQLWSYGAMAHAQARPARAKWVIGVEVDNRSFFGPPMNRKGPEDITDREFLAQIVRNAVDANAAVIALDINLVREETSSESTSAENAILWNGIEFAEKSGVPVVLTFAFDTKAMRPLNNTFDHQMGPLCNDPVEVNAPRTGFDHAPEDKRKVPLVVDAHSQDGSRELACRSFALQIVDAYERRLGMSKTSVERLHDTIADRQFAYTTFLIQSDFPHVSALDVYRGDKTALPQLDHRIVLVGGNRSAWPTADTNPPLRARLDYHASPEGLMAGMYFHANYVEGLLDDRIQSTIPRPVAAVIDMALATAVILSIHFLAGTLRLVVFTLLIVVPVLIAYVAMITVGYCFDFVVPVVLSFLHPAIERYLDLPRHLIRRHAHE